MKTALRYLPQRYVDREDSILGGNITMKGLQLMKKTLEDGEADEWKVKWKM